MSLRSSIICHQRSAASKIICHYCSCNRPGRWVNNTWCHNYAYLTREHHVSHGSILGYYQPQVIIHVHCHRSEFSRVVGPCHYWTLRSLWALVILKLMYTFIFYNWYPKAQFDWVAIRIWSCVNTYSYISYKIMDINAYPYINVR